MARSLSMGLLGCCLVAITPAISWADEDAAPPPSPRTTVTIGDASVVLFTANDRLYAFVDRLEDNAPVEDAELQVKAAPGLPSAGQGVTVPLNKATTGMFVGPFNRAGHVQDGFLVTLRSSAGTGEARTQITYGATPGAAPGTLTIGSLVALVGVSGSIGIMGGLLFVLWLRGRRRAGASSVGAAQTA